LFVTIVNVSAITNQLLTTISAKSVTMLETRSFIFMTVYKGSKFGLLNNQTSFTLTRPPNK